MTLEYLASIAQIILIDIVLSGDNAVVIAMAAHRLPAYQRKRAIMWGGGIAIFMRIVFTMIMAFLLMVPGVRLVGGLVLTWIACKLLLEEEEHAVAPDDADRSALAAIRMIFVADFVMSLDNMLAVAGASHGDWQRLLLGLIVSIGIIMTCSALIARLMNRYHWIVTVGAAILALTAGEMMLGDRELASFVVRNFGVCLNSHWEEEYMTSHVHLTTFDAQELSTDAGEFKTQGSNKYLFVGQMDEVQRDALLKCVSSDKDREAIQAMYEQARPRTAPEWVPGFLSSPVSHLLQRKWPLSTYRSIENSHYHFVAWIFYALVIGFCLSSPYWRKRVSAAKAEKPEAP